MVESTLTEIGRVTKNAVIGALKGTGEKAQAIVGATADLVKGTIEGVGDFTVAIEKRVEEILSGAIEGATEVGGDLFMTIKSYGLWNCESGFRCGGRCCQDRCRSYRWSHQGSNQGRHRYQ